MKVINYLKELITLTPQEKAFIKEFRNQNYKPELLFDDKHMVEKISHHPMALCGDVKNNINSINSNYRNSWANRASLVKR